MAFLSGLSQWFSLSLWERPGVRAKFFARSRPTLTLSQWVREGTVRRMNLFLALSLACLPSAVFAQATTPPAEPPKNIVEPLPEQSPPWLAGYQLRYTLRVVGDVTKSTSKA